MGSGSSRRRVIQGIGAAGLVGLAGCTGGDGDGATTGSPSDSGPLLFGGTISESGALAAPGKGVRDGYRIWREYVNNELGGINVNGQRRKIELKLYDDESSKDRLINLYRRLINQDGVKYLLGPFSSGLSLAVVPIAERNNVPLVAPTVTLLSAYRSENMFGVFPPNTTYFPTMLQPVLNLEENRPSRAALIIADDPGHNAAAKKIVQTLEGTDIELVMEKRVSPRPNELGAEITEAANKNADFFIGEVYTQGAIAAVKAAQNQEYLPKAMAFASGPSNPAFKDSLGTAAEGTIAPAPYHLQSKAEGPYFETNKNYIKQSQKHLDREPGSIAYPMATAAGLAYQRAFEEHAASTAPSDVVAGLNKVNMDTVVGHIEFIDQGKVKNANLNADVFVVQVQDNNINAIYPPDLVPGENQYRYPLSPWSSR